MNNTIDFNNALKDRSQLKIKMAIDGIRLSKTPENQALAFVNLKRHFSLSEEEERAVFAKMVCARMEKEYK